MALGLRAHFSDAFLNLVREKDRSKADQFYDYDPVMFNTDERRKELVVRSAGKCNILLRINQL